jgi:hypothetical protein
MKFEFIVCYSTLDSYYKSLTPYSALKNYSDCKTIKPSLLLKALMLQVIGSMAMEFLSGAM